MRCPPALFFSERKPVGVRFAKIFDAFSRRKVGDSMKAQACWVVTIDGYR